MLTFKQKMEICKRFENVGCCAVLMEEFIVDSSLSLIYDIKTQSQKIKGFYAKSESDKSVEKHHHMLRMEMLH